MIKFTDKAFQSIYEVNNNYLQQKDFKRLGDFLRNYKFYNIFNEAEIKKEVDYKPILDCLSKCNLESFMADVCIIPNTTTEVIMQQIYNAIDQCRPLPCDRKLSSVIAQSGLSDKNFFTFCERLSERLENIKSIDKKLGEATRLYNKSSSISKETSSIEKDKNARTNVLKQMAEIADAIRTITTFAFQLFQMFSQCNVSSLIKHKLMNFQRLALGEVELKQISGNSIVPLMFQNYTPNAYKIYNNSGEIRIDSENDTEHIS